MTNKDKFLRDGVSVEEFVEFLRSKQPNNKFDMTFHDIALWLNTPIKPTLTEDERVILRNIDKIFNCIGRTKNGTLFLRLEMFSKTDDRAFHFFNHLFQFIKERRRI